MTDPITSAADQPTEQDLVDFTAQLAATQGQLEPDPEPGWLSLAHADYLTAHAVDVQLAMALGVRTVSGKPDLAGFDEVWQSWANYPAIAFPWTSPDGRVEVQLRPDDPTNDSTGRPRKYVFRRGMQPVLWAVRAVDIPGDQVLVVEGTKQCLAAASYAPAGWWVYGIAGCRMWQHDGVPIPDLGVVDGREVVVILDADAAGNPDVYGAGMGLAEALAAEGASSVKFARLSAGGKSGLDDVLAARPHDRRASYLARLVAGAKAKPADKAPTRRRTGKKPAEQIDGRPMVDVTGDRLAVIRQLTSAMIDKWDRHKLFDHGGVISELEPGWSLGPARMHPVTKGRFNHLVVEATMPVTLAPDGTATHCWPDPNTMGAVLTSAREFTPLDRVVGVPFVRLDGTVATKNGYDEPTRTLLAAHPGLEDLSVSEAPTQEEVHAARDLILGQWLGDMPFDTDDAGVSASRANALALVLTPFIRGMVPLVPLAVVDGLQMSVGKNLLADCLSILVTGRAADVLPYSPDDVEQRKVITSTFRSGASLFCFDEAHELTGASFARAITALTYSDRVLGVSEMAEFPNRVTWLSLGNNVSVRGDMSRRVYRIRLAPTGGSPENRPLSMYRHPDLRGWTLEHRAELVTAALTLIRAWFAAGQPMPTGESWFGSFEAWQRICGGILQLAGVPGFLDNVREWRSETDFFGQYRAAHLEWLREQFGPDHRFTAAQVRAKAMADPAGYQAPDDLDDPTPRDYAKKLGMHYAKIEGRRYQGLTITKIKPEGNTRKSAVWMIREDGAGFDDSGAESPDGPDTPDGGTHRDPEGPPHPTRKETFLHVRDTRVHTYRGSGGPYTSPEVPPVSDRALIFDLETADANDLHTYGPGFVRLAGWAVGDSVVATAASRDGFEPAGTTVARLIRDAGSVTGHNIMAFDLPALVRAGRLTMDEIHAMAVQGRVFDTLLAARHLDPPMAREHGVDAQRRYDLDSLGERLELGRKTDSAKALAKKWGGFDKIPVDDPDYRAYLVGDVELSRRLYHQLRGELVGGPEQVPPYLTREHRVAAIAAQISYNGFRVDVAELDRRVADTQTRKAGSLELLHDRYGVPLVDPKGKAYASPLATKAGKAALVAALTKAGATRLWTTPKAGDIDLSGEHMLHLSQEYHHLPAVREIAKHVYRVVSARSVYETVAKHLDRDTGRVHPKIGFEQATGRWSTTSPGLTVMGKRGGRHVEREVFLPDPGELVICVDLSQVDMRGVAGLSGDGAYIAMLATEDPHSEIAAALFGDRRQREAAKAIGHGWNYGRGIKAISQGEEIDVKIVRDFDVSMRERFPRLVEWQDEVRAVAESGLLLDNGFGRPMRADPRRAHTQGPALMGQGAARDLMMTGLLRLADQMPEALPMLRAQIHDEVVLSVPAADAMEIQRAVVDALSFEWDAPGGTPVSILAEGGKAGQTWGAVYAKD